MTRKISPLIAAAVAGAVALLMVGCGGGSGGTVHPASALKAFARVPLGTPAFIRS